MPKTRMAVLGVGAFGKNHVRVIRESERAELVAVLDQNQERARAVAAEYGCRAVSTPAELVGLVDAAVVAVPTQAHAAIGCRLLDAGIHLLMEKPIAPDMAAARRLAAAAERAGRVLQVGHLERFNPGVIELRKLVTLPLFFEIHRLSVFTPRSLDVDVVLDLMIHDVDLLLSMVGQQPEEIRAAGISILSPRVDIANVRIAFANGCIANLTASRVSTEKVRKLRLFQPGQYISLDYARRDGIAITVSPDHELGFQQLSAAQGEPLRLQLESFLDCVETGTRPQAGGEQAILALEVCLAILDKIEEHTRLVAETIRTARNQR
ncbi:MAG: Gfo/Idh/MocA family oxidoreductase [Bryobacterales bacterium]|nr:Gfo/Idh/MocA family oxidoreductase [Bryobacterales bacterium]